MVTVIFVVYWIAVGLLTIYGLNCHVLVYLFQRRVHQRVAEDRRLVERFYQEQGQQALPVVTSQIPIYNEMNVAERIIDAVAAFDYPSGKHDIQVLDDSTDETSALIAQKVDDSTDETSALIAQKVATLQAQGRRIEHIRRASREGFKAGALQSGLEHACGEFVAIFDADFVPARDFLLKAMPFFLMVPRIGLVQGRWGHLNSEENLITRFESLGLDAHFVVEQAARNWNDLFMNFNGTAGILRKQAIVEAGNWMGDTLTEDLDLSYRMQIKGWKCRYLLDLVVPAELPSNIQAFKNQQFRWAKGSVQTALKLLPALWTSRNTFFRKLTATLHLTHSLVHPLMVYLSILAPSLLTTQQLDFPPVLSLLWGLLLFLGFWGPSRMYWTAEKYLYGGWSKRALFLPFLVYFGSGLAINNTRAILQAFFAQKTEFIRTPKKGNVLKKSYTPFTSFAFLFEIFAGIWCATEMIFFLAAQNYIAGYFLLIYTIGFLYVGSTSFFHQRRFV